MLTKQRTRKSNHDASHLLRRKSCFLPKAAAAEKESLKESIKRHGVLVPILQNSDGTIIDGKLKKSICEELGIVTCPTEILQVDARTAEQIRLQLNICRRNISLTSRRALAQLTLLDDPEQSDRMVGRLSGLSHRTVAAIREVLVVRGQIAQVKIRKGNDKKTYKKFTKVRAKTRKAADKAAAILRTLGDAAPKRELEMRSLKRFLRDAEKSRKKVQPPLPCEDIKIEHGDFRSLDLEPASVDLIYTDPLYGKQHLPLYSELATFAATVLKPSGILMAYAPQVYLNEAIQRLDKHLSFYWACALINSECRQPNFQRGFFSGYRPVLVYTKGTSGNRGVGGIIKSDDYVRDTFTRGRKDKSLYAYQQPIDEAIYYIGKFTKPGDLIVDCFGGSFTTAEAVHRLGGRRFIGCDTDKTCVALGRERLGKLLEDGEPQ